MSERIKHRLHKENSKTSVNTDTNVDINLQQNNRLLPFGDMNRILDVGEQFQKERNDSTNYRFILSISSLFTNVLTDIGSDPTHGSSDTLALFNTNPFKYVDGDVTNEPLFTTKQGSVDYYRVDNGNGWVGYYKPIWDTGGKCQFIDLKPKRELFDLTPVNNIKNWDIFLTYPAKTNNTHYLVNNGLVIIYKELTVIDGKNYMMLTSPTKHGLTSGDIIKINNDKIYNVIRLGRDNGDYLDYTFVIDLDYSVTSVGVQSRFKRMENNIPSDYYIRIFEKITSNNDYEIYPLAFSKTLYSDKMNQIVFNKDIDISQYTDNLGRPLSEIYLTILKTNDNGFSDINSGIEMPLLNGGSQINTIGDIRRLHNVTTWPILSDTPIELNLTSNDNEFYGDIVEYNKITVQEKVLGEISHRFNRYNRDYNGRPEGYFYKPHYQIKLRDWSTFTEVGDINSVIGIPDYAEYLGDDLYIWRDLLEIGVNDGQPEVLDYPFLNGSHYPYSNININLRRQDPFNKYGLYYVGDSNNPNDIFGIEYNKDKFVVKKGETDNGSC